MLLYSDRPTWVLLANEARSARQVPPLKPNHEVRYAHDAHGAVVMSMQPCSRYSPDISGYSNAARLLCGVLPASNEPCAAARLHTPESSVLQSPWWFRSRCC